MAVLVPTSFWNSLFIQGHGFLTVLERHDEEGAIDPVCGMSVDPEHAAATRTHQGTDYSFCSIGCAELFEADPTAFVGQADPTLSSAEPPRVPRVA